MTQICKPAKSPKAAARTVARLDRALNPDLFKALSDRTRNQLLACLAKCDRACSVSEVAECCHVDFSVVSRHLAVLAKVGALVASKRGRVVYYSVRYKELQSVFEELAAAFADCSSGCCESGGADKKSRATRLSARSWPRRC